MPASSSRPASGPAPKDPSPRFSTAARSTSTGPLAPPARGSGRAPASRGGSRRLVRARRAAHSIPAGQGRSGRHRRRSRRRRCHPLRHRRNQPRDRAPGAAPAPCARSRRGRLRPAVHRACRGPPTRWSAPACPGGPASAEASPAATPFAPRPLAPARHIRRLCSVQGIAGQRRGGGPLRPQLEGARRGTRQDSKPPAP